MKAQEDIAPISFLILKSCGLWCPLGFNASQILVYSIYTGLTLILLITIALLLLLSVCSMPFSDENFSENVFLMFALFNACFKAFNILLSRKRFIKMLSILQEPRWKKNRSHEEIEIRDKFKKTIRKISLYFTTAVFVAILLRNIVPLLDTSEGLQLPVKAFQPCNITDPKCYWALYWHQALGTSLATLIHAAKDCLISALLLQICSQLQILKQRLLSIPGSCKAAKIRKENIECIVSLERKLISDCIEDHQSIFMFSKILNKSLNIMLFGEIAVTLPNLCLSIYLLSKTKITSMEFMMTTQFFSAVVIELFFFCWYGNEVTVNSLDVENAVCEMDWDTLSISSRKDLVVLMIRTSKPILFRVGPIMNMNIDSFLKIMKMSYSAFNVLQSSGE